MGRHLLDKGYVPSAVQGAMSSSTTSATVGSCNSMLLHCYQKRQSYWSVIVVLCELSCAACTTELVCIISMCFTALRCVYNLAWCQATLGMQQNSPELFF